MLQQTPTLPLQVIITGHYHDRFICERFTDNHATDNNGEWHFVEREMNPQLLGDLSQHLLFDMSRLQ